MNPRNGMRQRGPSTPRAVNKVKFNNAGKTRPDSQYVKINTRPRLRGRYTRVVNKKYYNKPRYETKNKKPYTSEGSVGSKEVDVAKAIEKNKMVDAADGDPRYATDPNAPQYRVEAPYINKGININPRLNPKAFDGVASALLQRALTAGFDSALNKDLVNAGAFIKNILLNAAAGSEPLTDHVPSYLETFQLAVSPRTITSKKQKFNYAFQEVPNSAPFLSTQNYGSSGRTGVLNFGSVSNTSGTYGLKVIVPETASDSLTEQSQAFVRLTQVLANADKTNPKSHLPMSLKDKEFLASSAAAFSCPTIVYGNAFGGTGGDVVRIGNETPVHPDVLSVFAAAAGSFAQAARAPNYNSSRGGGCMEATFFASTHKPRTLEKITRPVIKFINFNDLFYVYCKSLQLAVQLYVDKPDAMLVTKEDTPGSLRIFNTVAPECTMLEAALAFRNTLMLAFSNTQWATSSITPTNATEETFLGLTSCIGTSPMPLQYPLQMSIYLTENIRALTGRRSQDSDGNWRWFLPVLGVYMADMFDGRDFQITLTDPNGSERKVNLFKDTSLYERKNGGGAKKKDVKEKRIPLPKVGSPSTFRDDKEPHVFTKVNSAFEINIHDGSSENGPLAINNPDFLQTITNALNNCSSAVGKYIQCRGVFASAPPANALTQIGVTNYLIDKPAGEGNLYGESYFTAGTTYSYGPAQDIIESFPMVTPTRFVLEEAHLANNDDVRVVAATNGETYNRAIISGGLIPNWRKYLDGVAQNCIGDGTTTNVVKRIQELSATGSGGIASDLLNTFAPVAVPLIGQGLDAVLKMF